MIVMGCTHVLVERILSIVGEEPKADRRHVCVMAIGPFTTAEAVQIRSVTFIRLGRVDELGKRVGDGLSHACDAQVE
jgi:hypothetical protein